MRHGYVGRLVLRETYPFDLIETKSSSEKPKTENQGAPLMRYQDWQLSKNKTSWKMYLVLEISLIDHMATPDSLYDIEDLEEGCISQGEP